MGNLNLFKFFIHNELQSQPNKIWGNTGNLSFQIFHFYCHQYICCQNSKTLRLIGLPYVYKQLISPRLF